MHETIKAFKQSKSTTRGTLRKGFLNPPTMVLNSPTMVLNSPTMVLHATSYLHVLSGRQRVYNFITPYQGNLS